MTGNPTQRYRVYLLSYKPSGAPPLTQTKLVKEIKKTPGWAKYFESTWLLATHEDARTIWNRLEPYLTPNDSILIIEAAKDSYGRLPKKAWEWFKSVRELNDKAGG